MHRRLLFVFAAMLLPAAVWPQGVPLGPEFRVNTYTPLTQRAASVAADASGNFVAVWNSNDQDGSGRGVFGQRFTAPGAPLGPEFLVNTYTSLNQLFPAVAADASGNFVVVWTGNGPPGTGIFGQRFASSGAPVGSEFKVNTLPAGGFGVYPSVAAAPAGNFVVVWRGLIPGGSLYDISGQRYSSAGAPLGAEFRVNTFTTFNQDRPSVAADAAGNFVVVWQSSNQDGSATGVFGQRFAASGATVGPEFRVNSYVPNEQDGASVAMDSAGNFVVVWTSYGQDGDAHGIFGQRFASSGTPLGPEFRVNTITTNVQAAPSVAADSSGNFVAVWNGQDASQSGVFGQRFAGSGTPLGPEFRVNTFITSDQVDPSVAADSTGRFVVVWTSYLQDGAEFGIYGQRYDVILPVELMHFRVE